MLIASRAVPCHDLPRSITHHATLPPSLSLFGPLSGSLTLFPIYFYREAKAVNAWFANKRSASKKKSRGLIANEPYITNSLSASASPPPSFNRYHNHNQDDDNSSLRSTPMHYHSSHYALDSDAQQDSLHRPAFDGQSAATPDNGPRRMRIRPTPQQREELERVFERNTHPSRDEREALGDRIGM